MSKTAIGLAISNPILQPLHQFQREQLRITFSMASINFLEVSTPHVEEKASFADAQVRAVEDLEENAAVLRCKQIFFTSNQATGIQPSIIV